MANTQKFAAFLGRMAAMPALFLLMLFAGSSTAYAADYELYIGSTQVTDANAGNIFGANGADGQPTAKYDATSKTLYLNGVHIDTDHNYVVRAESDDGYSPRSHYSMFAGTDVVRHLVINGDNSFVSAGSEIVHRYNAIEYDEDYYGVDVTGDGVFDINDMGVEVSRAEGSGIHFSAQGRSAAEAFTITGTGTLTSTSTEGIRYNYDVYGVDWVFDEDRREVNIGTALTVEGGGWVYIGNTDGTGPRLELTGWDKGANFGGSSRFVMQGGTMIAKATSTEQGVGVNLAGISDSKNYFEGGTIAGYGKYSGYGSGAFSPKTVAFDEPNAKTHGMTRVYPELGTISGDEKAPSYSRNLENISGWCVAGMTADGFKADTDAVLQELGLDGSGGGDNPGTDPVNPDTPGGGGGTGEVSDNSYHTDNVPDPGAGIDVQGYTKDATVYSVDVEWGVMTFQYEKSSWDAETHTTKPGGGWRIYDNEGDKIISENQDAINRITVTNHSNAEVFATLSYTGNESYTDITGGFTTKADDADTDFTAAADPKPAYLTLATADNDKGTEADQGKETAGSVYFMPNGIGKTGDVANDIAQWQKIGKITVGLFTAQP